MKKGDKVKIIDPKHCGFGEECEIIWTQTKRGKKIYKVDGTEVGYLCRKEQIEKI